MNGTGPPVRLFGYAPGRDGGHAADLYAGIHQGAVLITDGYEVYNCIARTQAPVHLGFWVHCRRYFIEAEAVLPKSTCNPAQLAAQFITTIVRLYAVEARSRAMPPVERGHLRSEQSQPVFTKIEVLLQRYLHNSAPNSLLGKALHYLQGQWPKLIRYVENGAWPIDNNPCENRIRPFVVGRRNRLFADTVGGSTASANL